MVGGSPNTFAKAIFLDKSLYYAIFCKIVQHSEIMVEKAANFLTIKRIYVLYVLVFVGVGIQKYLQGGYNNYLMFTMPFGWMLKGQSMYDVQVFLFEDLYKYSPTFAWLMSPFYALSNIGLGVILWNLLNTSVLLFGTYRFLKNDVSTVLQKVLLIVFLEGLITAQNIQSNNLILGLMLLGLAWLRGGQVFWAALMFSLAAYFKVYGAAVAIFFVFYPQKIKFLASMAFWMLVLALLPLTVMSWPMLLSENLKWLAVAAESKLGQQVSVMGILQSWFGLKVNFNYVSGIGFVLFMLPLLQFKKWQSVVFQRFMLAYLLLFIIIFNKMAESPTYVYAVMGVALWFTNLEKPSTSDWFLLILVLVFTSLSPSDLFPRTLRDQFLVPYNIKAFPCILVWVRLQWLVWRA